MEKQQTVVIGHGVVANAIAGQLAQAGHAVTHVALAGGNHADLPSVLPPRQVWPLEAQPAVAPAAEPMFAETLQLSLNAAGQLQLAINGQPPVVPAHIIIASSRAAARLLPQVGLKLPLRPVRCHAVPLRLPAGIAETTHLSRGSIIFVPQNNSILYDGLIDPRQATFQQTADTAVQTALEQWLIKRNAAAGGPAAVLTTATTPDFLPAFGPWQVDGNKQFATLWLAVGWHMWGTGIAGSVAAKLLAMLGGDTNTDIDISRLNPTRFHTGNWQKAERPSWLPEHAQPQLVGGQKEVTRADTVNTVDSPNVERGKNIQVNEAPTMQRAGQITSKNTKSKVQVSPLSGAK
ncbi:MAG TPA: hypothetical protein VHP58_05305 [Alphaproteobacteria bacterium]|nr:hypothetical protein [Alphaproteobacteria bacterium]